MYNANGIQVLKGIEHVRKRPGMYFGGRPIIYEMIWEVVGEAIIQCQQPVTNTITVRLFDDGIVSVAHDGKGYTPNKHQKSIVECMKHLFFTDIWSNQFKPQEVNGISFMPMFVIYAASRKLVVQTGYDGYLWQHIYEANLPVTEIKQLPLLDDSSITGAIIQFQPDFTVFEQHEVHFWQVYWQLQLLSRFFCDIELFLDDRRSNPEVQGSVHVTDYVMDSPIHEPLAFEAPPDDDEYYDIDLQYHRTVYPCVKVYHNGLPELNEKYTAAHIAEGLRRFFNLFLYENGNAPPDTLSVSDVCVGLSLTVRGYKDPSQTHYYRLANEENLNEALQDTLNNLRMDDPLTFYRMIEKCLDNRHYRVAQQ